MMLPRLNTAADPLVEKQLPDRWELSLLHKLMFETRFRENYQPVVIHFGGEDVFVYMSTEYLDRHRDDARLSAIGWQALKAPPAEEIKVTAAD